MAGPSPRNRFADTLRLTSCEPILVPARSCSSRSPAAARPCGRSSGAARTASASSDASDTARGSAADLAVAGLPAPAGPATESSLSFRHADSCRSSWLMRSGHLLPRERGTIVLRRRRGRRSASSLTLGSRIWRPSKTRSPRPSSTTELCSRNPTSRTGAALVGRSAGSCAARRPPGRRRHARADRRAADGARQAADFTPDGQQAPRVAPRDLQLQPLPGPARPLGGRAEPCHRYAQASPGRTRATSRSSPSSRSRRWREPPRTGSGEASGRTSR